MASVDQPRRALPNFRTARLVGIFNVLFSTQILLCGLCTGGYVVSIPMWTGMLNRVQKETEAQAETARKAEIQALEAEIEAAKTAEDKVLAVALREEVAKRPKPTLPVGMDFNQLGLTDPMSLGWSWVEVLTGLAVNVLMLISGIGLLHWKPWARTLGVWTAALKVVRLAVLYGFFIVAIVPPVAKNLGAMVVQMAAQQQLPMGRPNAAVPDAAMFTRVYTVMYSVMGVGMAVLGSVYPLIVLWLLTRPGVKSACSGVYKLPPEPKQPW